MSVVVAIKQGGVVYMGCDSQVTKGGSRTTLRNKNNFKIWAVEGAANCLMGHVGVVREANIVRLLDDLVTEYNEYKGHVNYRFVVKKVVPDIIDALKSANYLDSNDKFFDAMGSSFVFAYKDQLFSISSDGCVLEVDDFVAIGSGECEAVGSLLSTEGLCPKERIVRAIKSSAASDLYVDYPIIISDTKNTEFDIITEKNEASYIEARRKENGSKTRKERR